MKWQALLAGFGIPFTFALPSLAEDGGGAGGSSEEASWTGAAPKAKHSGLDWSTFSAGLSARRGPMSGATGWWGDLNVAFRTEFAGPVDIRFELSAGYGRPERSNEIPLGTLTSSGTALNDEYMDTLSGLVRVALEIPQDPLRLRIGPAVGAGTGEFTSTGCNDVGTIGWERAIFGGGVDAVVGIGDPVFLEPFVRFDVLYLSNPECAQGPPVSDTSPTFLEPRVRYNDEVSLFVGAGLMLSF